MKKEIFLTIILLLPLYNLTAQKSSKKIESINANRSIEITEITEISENIIEIKDKPMGLKTYKNISAIKPTNRFTNNIDTTIIDINNINDSLYSQMYEFWFDTDISSHDPILIADINNNGNAEMYGHIFELDGGYEVAKDFVIYEFNPTKESFELVYTFKKHKVGGYYGGVFDVNQNGSEQVCLVDMVGNESRYIQHAEYYANTNENELPTTVDFYYSESGQCNNYTYGDFNKDGIVDLLYYRLNPATIKISEYNDSLNNFKTVFEYNLDLNIDNYGGGFAVEDVDGDGFEEFTFGSINGNLYVFEYQPLSKRYELIFQDTLRTYNAYLHFSTNDIDGNGKKEFWAGGDAFFNGQGITNFWCYEATGNNQYKVVHTLKILNLFSSSAGNMFTIDMDKDGKDEIFICVDHNIIVLKFNGTPNNPSYSIYYHWRNPKYDYGYIEGAIMYDLDHDGFKEIIIHGKYSTTTPPQNGYAKAESWIYRPTDLVAVKETKKENLDFRLYQNYPNPFNPKTVIRYKIGDTRFVSIIVYNMLGQEVATLINKEQKAGSYNIIFNGDNLPSGLYLIKMTTGKYSNTIKTLLIK